MKKRISLHDSLGYVGLMVLANLAGAITMLLCLYFFSKSNDRDWIIQHYKWFSILFAIIAITGTAIITGIYFHYKMPDTIHPESDVNWKFILKDFCRLVLPGELLRFVLCILPTNPGKLFGYRFFDGFLALVPNFLYDQFYMTPNNRLESIRDVGYTATDTWIFVALYLFYFVVVMNVYFYMFKTMWHTAVITQKNEVKLRMDPSQMK